MMESLWQLTEHSCSEPHILTIQNLLRFIKVVVLAGFGKGISAGNLPLRQERMADESRVNY